MYGVCYVRIENRIEIVVTFVYPVCKRSTIFLVSRCCAMNSLEATMREYIGIVHFFQCRYEH